VAEAGSWVAGKELSVLIAAAANRAEAEIDVLMPGYTRQPRSYSVEPLAAGMHGPGRIGRLAGL
jgi:argininosuccinate lyase